MKGLLAALYKDIRLMMNGTGILTLLLAVLLLPVFVYGTRDLSVESIVSPFPIAVRDLDETVMSRSLIQQIREVELFSEVRLTEGEEDGQALSKGAACVLTIPKDFFYVMYTGGDCPVEVVLNDDMPLESSIVDTMLSSILDIIHADQAAWRGIYSYVYGTPGEAELQQMYEDASRDIFSDALSRQRVFRTEITPSDMVGVTRKRLSAVLLPMLAMLFSLSALQTLPQEEEMGALKRYRVLGGSTAAFLTAKCFAVLFWTVPLSVLLYFLSGVTRPLLFFVLAASTLAASFGVMYMIVVWTGEENAARRWCNIYLLLSLFLGGTLIAPDALPGILSKVRHLCVARYVYPVLHAMDTGESTLLVLLRISPLLLMAAAAFLFAIPLKRIRARKKTRGAAPAGEGADPYEKETSPFRLRGPLARTGGVTLSKVFVYAGGAGALVVSCLCVLLIGYAVRGAEHREATSLRIAVTDRDGTAASETLLALLEEKAASTGLKLIVCSEARARNLVIDGAAEGALVIGEGYEEALSEDAQTPLDYTGTASAFSSQAVREIIAGQVAVQRAGVRARETVAQMTGERLTREEEEELDARIVSAAGSLPSVYRVRSESGARRADPFSPARISFLALCLILMLLTASAFTARTDARSAERRLLGVRYAFAVTFLSDLCALFVFGLVLSVCFYLPGGFPGAVELLTVCVFCLSIAALALMLARVASGTGRVDALAPILTLIICLVGGCFLDLSAIAAQIARLMMISPAGAALALTRGEAAGALILLAETLIFILPAIPRRR